MTLLECDSLRDFGSLAELDLRPRSSDSLLSPFFLTQATWLPPSTSCFMIKPVLALLDGFKRTDN